ncbi:MAG TPA: hypothetical protein VF941_02680 [Clostridia bacterium]
MTQYDRIRLYIILFNYLATHEQSTQKLHLAYDIGGKMIPISLDTIPRIVERKSDLYVRFSTTDQDVPIIEIGPLHFLKEDLPWIELLSEYHIDQDRMDLILESILSLMQSDTIVKQYVIDFYQIESEKHDLVKRQEYTEAAIKRDAQKEKLKDFLSHLSIATEGGIADNSRSLDSLDKVLKNDKEKLLVHVLKQEIRT